MDLLPFKDGAEMQFYATLYFWVANAYMRLEDAGNALAWIEKGLEFFPDDVDLNYLMAVFGFLSGQDEVLKGFSDQYFKAVKKYNKKPFSSEEFVNVLHDGSFIPRTVFCLGRGHKDHIKWCLDNYENADTSRSVAA